MPYSDEEGYSAVDHDQKYFTAFRAVIVAAIVIVMAAGASPQGRDWAWRTFMPGDYARAHAPTPTLGEVQAVVEARLARMRKCSDGSIAFDGTCKDGSAGQPLPQTTGR